MIERIWLDWTVEHHGLVLGSDARLVKLIISLCKWLIMQNLKFGELWLVLSVIS